MSKEIERKWILNKLPMEPADAKYWNEQFYISLEPEVRLRRSEPHGDYDPVVPYRLCVKGNGTLSRDEFQCPVTGEFYEAVRDWIDLDPIQKHFLIYNRDGYQIEISVVDKNAFIYAEVEFHSEEEARDYQFPWPELIAGEVTDNPDWKMKNYWKRTRLD